LAPFTPVNSIVVVPSACASGVRTRSSPKIHIVRESFIQFSMGLTEAPLRVTLVVK
jgi:hypothetical protein